MAGVGPQIDLVFKGEDKLGPYEVGVASMFASAVGQNLGAKSCEDVSADGEFRFRYRVPMAAWVLYRTDREAFDVAALDLTLGYELELGVQGMRFEAVG
jgi:hypothetical protein